MILIKLLRFTIFTGLCHKQILVIIIFSICKQLLDESFVISAMTKGEVSVINQGCMPSVITPTKTLIIPDTTKPNLIILFYYTLFRRK